MSASLGRWHNLFSLVFPLSLALLGLSLALRAWTGIEAARKVIRRWRAKQGELLVRNPGQAEYSLAAPAGAPADGRPRQGTMFSRYAPYVFAAAWCCFGAMPVAFCMRT